MSFNHPHTCSTLSFSIELSISPSLEYAVTWNQWNSMDSNLPRISTGVSACGVHRPTSNQIPYRPSNCLSSSEILSGGPWYGNVVRESLESRPGSKFNGFASRNKLMTASTIYVCISGSICQADDNDLCTMWSPPRRLLCRLPWHCAQYRMGWLPL